MIIRLAKLTGLMLLIVLVTVNCGKKGPLKLEPELKPLAVAKFQLSQVGQSIRLQWAFPQELSGKASDKKKKEFLMENIKAINVYYSNKEILGGKFRKKSTLLKKLTAADLTIFTDASVNLLAPKKKKKNAYNQNIREEKNLNFFVLIPFQLKDLQNKQHFFGIQYVYWKKKSPMSKIVFINTLTPIKPATGLTIIKENKLLKLQWKRPQTDASGVPSSAITGYKIYKKIAPETLEENNETGSSEPQFIQLNKENILKEYFEDTDTGTNGDYCYYISTVMTPEIQSAPSNEATIKITDIYPPEIPANLTTFKAGDHLFITWRGVSDKDFSYYRLYRRSNSESEFKLLADQITGNQHKDKNVTKGLIYFYTITSVDLKGNESEYSPVVSEQF
jgi:predicted small lipoprotein YifL